MNSQNEILVSEYMNCLISKDTFELGNKSCFGFLKTIKKRNGELKTNNLEHLSWLLCKKVKCLFENKRSFSFFEKCIKLRIDDHRVSKELRIKHQIIQSYHWMRLYDFLWFIQNKILGMMTTEERKLQIRLSLFLNYWNRHDTKYTNSTYHPYETHFFNSVNGVRSLTHSNTEKYEKEASNT